ncbi:MAG TPA: ABC transporter ATP-binding protein [Anaerolineae bacterium]|nr:ABC transporter ATP-binding protein [Anaerolineae bacterium]
MLVYDIQNVTKYYPGQTRPANRDVSLQIHTGEIFGILGDNGAGKTTLIRQMMNLLRSTSGEITLFGQPVTRDPLWTPRNVGYMPQESSSLNCLTVGEALYYTAHLRGLRRAEAQDERESLLDLWQIREMRDQYSNRLSGGQRRLLRLAVATVGAPPVLILDEPTNDLDPQRRKRVWDVLRRLNAERGTTIIFITHDAIEAEKIIQRVAIMRDGALAAVGRPADLKRTVDQKLRLELFCSPDAPPHFPPPLTPHEVQPGRWTVLVERQAASAVLGQLDLTQVDDFRLYSATLEDLYLHYAAVPA